ncbi:MAG: hypothetical protein ACLS3M_06845 [Collinsella sp.]
MTTATSSTTASTAAALSPARTNLCLALLVLLGFSLGCSEFVVIGIESDLATELGISLPPQANSSACSRSSTPSQRRRLRSARDASAVTSYSCGSIVFVLGNLVMALAPNSKAVCLRIILAPSGAPLAVA